MSLLEELKNTNFPYSPTIVRDMIDANFEKYGYVRPETKMIIFYMMKRVVLRGAVTFFNINKNRKNDVNYEMDGLVNELYMVLSNCTEKFDTRQKKDFYLYFSSSVSRRVSRMANYKKINNDEITFTKYGNTISNDEDVEVEEMLEDKQIQEHRTDNEFKDYIQALDLDEMERGVVNSIVNDRSVRDTLMENGISRVEYDEVMEILKYKLKGLY